MRLALRRVNDLKTVHATRSKQPYQLQSGQFGSVVFESTAYRDLNLTLLEVLRAFSRYRIRNPLMLFLRLGLTAAIIASGSIARLDFAFAAESEVVIEEAKIAMPPRGAPSMAGYLVIRNGSDEAVAVEAVESEMFGSISIHVTTIENGVASMRPAPIPFQIPGHSELQMKPGGVHLMIADPSAGLEAGGSVGLDVRFTDGSVVRAEAELVPFGGRPADHHHGASHE